MVNRLHSSFVAHRIEVPQIPHARVRLWIARLLIGKGRGAQPGRCPDLPIVGGIWGGQVCSGLGTMDFST